MKISELKNELEKIEVLKHELDSLVCSHEKIIILGNGGSNSIASHISQDYTKALGKKAITFTDPSRLTCYINDYGMESAYRVFIEEFATKETLVILISSSGNSMNIVNAAMHCNENDIKTATLSGFDKENKLNKITSELNYWVNSTDYGVVECAHLIFLHSIIKYL